MKNGLHHVALSAVNLDQTVNFYQKAFGFTLLRRWGEEKPAAMLDMGGDAILEIFSGADEGEESGSRKRNCGWARTSPTGRSSTRCKRTF